MTSVDDPLTAGRATTAEALSLFDRLDPVDEGFMLGDWRGSGLATGHPMDGLLEAYGWLGKRFENRETVHPLVFASCRGRRINVHPMWLLPFVGWLARHGLPHHGLLPWLFERALPLLSTRQPGARLRITRYRGRDTATMIYDHLPINDVFRRIDDDRVLGIMDMRRMAQPFFFILRRESMHTTEGR